MIESTADFSECGTYRYELVRRWDDGALVTWVMLNPSTADATFDDPTIRRCIGFSRKWKWGGIRVVNLYALRSPNPRDLVDSAEAGVSLMGARNYESLERACRARDGAPFVVAAWGASNPWPRTNAIRVVLGSAEEAGRAVCCLGTTKAGHPRHPLYVKGDQPLHSYRPC